MSVSTNAILFYGFEVGEDDAPWIDEEWEWETYYVDKLGLPYPEHDYGTPEWKEAISQYWAEEQKLLNDAGCAIDEHCSNEYPIRYVYVERIVANRGYKERINSINFNPEWDAKLKAFCKVMGIEYQEPAWWLVSYWG